MKLHHLLPHGHQTRSFLLLLFSGFPSQAFLKLHLGLHVERLLISHRVGNGMFFGLLPRRLSDNWKYEQNTQLCTSWFMCRQRRDPQMLLSIEPLCPKIFSLITSVINISRIHQYYLMVTWHVNKQIKYLNFIVKIKFYCKNR